jgi:hypothetical protein
VVTVVLGEYLCLQRELEAIPLTAEEREMRERRSANQHAINAGLGGGGGGGSGGGHDRNAHHEERAGLLGDSHAQADGKGVTTTTIRLAPNNVFNV